LSTEEKNHSSNKAFFAKEHNRSLTKLSVEDKMISAAKDVTKWVEIGDNFHGNSVG
jgi:hypothetical protein